MCGRYALALRPSEIRRMLEDEKLPVAEAPEDESSEAPRQSFNFAPGYTGLVYRADVPDWGAGPRHAIPSPKTTSKAAHHVELSVDVDARYKLQSMRWGLIPSWTRKAPDYAGVMRTINCRSDSLQTSGGMWQSMKARKRCIVLAQGFFEWLGNGPKNKRPHYVRRKDGRLLCFAGLWDSVCYQGAETRTYSYSIITTDSNKELRFLHNRMPVIFDPDSEELRQWIDPSRHEWSRELQCLLKPYDGELEVYPVVSDVGKIGNNSPSFIIPLDSKDNKSNITRFLTTNHSRERADEKTTAGSESSDDTADQIDVKVHVSPCTDSKIQMSASGRGQRKRPLVASGDPHANDAFPSKRPELGSPKETPSRA